MNNHLHCICLALIFFILGLFSVPTVKKTVDEKNTESKNHDGKDIVTRYYSDVTGFGIPHEDEANIIKHGGAPTYGEMTLEGAEELLKYLNPQKNDVFIDAGCGVGKLVVHTFFSTDAAKCKGIELSCDRAAKATRIKTKLEEDQLVPNHRCLEFDNGDILKADIADATIFFMCSTCFSPELMQKITDRLVDLKPGLRVVTLKQLPNKKDFVLKDTLQLPMTWSTTSPVYIYELVSKK